MPAPTRSFLPAPELSFPCAFEARTRERPESVAFTEVVTRGREHEDVHHRVDSVDRLASAAAAALAESGVALGDRVVLAIEAPLPFLAWFLGAHRIGAIPVPLPALAELDVPEAFRQRVEDVVEDCAPRVVVVESERALRGIGAFGARGMSLLASDSLDGAASITRASLPVALSHPAFLQYTSGSTGRPKGVVVTHGNLVSNFRAIALGAGFGPDERSVSWLPLYHDMGLIGGFLLGIHMRTSVIVMRPRAFAFRPDLWLRTMSRHRATFTVAPNFAYSLVARKLPDAAFRDVDLTSLRLAFNGAEPIDRATVDAFVERLAPHGLRRHAMYPVYGLAECTLAVAFPEPETLVEHDLVSRERLYASGEAHPCEPSADAVAVVKLGRAVPDHVIRIVDPETGASLPDRRTGEVVVEGPSVSPGYFGAAARSEPCVRTGDLGYLVDGALHIVDRIKDLVILRGRNFAPSDLERSVARVPGLTRGAVVAFGTHSDDGTERLVIVAAVDGASLRSSDAIHRDVVKQLAEMFGIGGADVRLVEPGSIPKTSSGKVRRRACREAYDAGALAEVDGVIARTRVLARRLGRRIGAALADS